MGELLCPACKQEVKTLRIQYECANGHTWGEAVDRAVTDTPRRASGPGGRRMPFGKHKGELLEDLPVDYIRWVLGNLEDLRGDLRDELQNQLDLKEGKGVVRENVRKEGKKFHFGG